LEYPLEGVSSLEISPTFTKMVVYYFHISKHGRDIGNFLSLPSPKNKKEK